MISDGDMRRQLDRWYNHSPPPYYILESTPIIIYINIYTYHAMHEIRAINIDHDCLTGFCRYRGALEQLTIAF